MNTQLKQQFASIPLSTRLHCQRTAYSALMVAQSMELDPKATEEIYLAGLFHDVGKIRIPASILDKPGSLTQEERQIINTHPEAGVSLMQGLASDPVLDMIRYHHENMDGSGYYGLSGDQIPLGARILHVCDVYDALTSARSYKAAMPSEKALGYLEAHTGTYFDRDCVQSLACGITAFAALSECQTDEIAV